MPDLGRSKKRRGRLTVVPTIGEGVLPHPEEAGSSEAPPVLSEGALSHSTSESAQQSAAVGREGKPSSMNEPATTATKEPATSTEATDESVTGEPAKAATDELTPVQRLAANLDAFLDNALSLAKQVLRQCDCRDDESLHSLRQLDAHLDDNVDVIHSPEFVRQHLAPLGVYLGAVVRRNANATWFVDDTQQSPIEALALGVQTPSGERVFRPTQIALERLTDSERGFYGHAVDMCRKL